MVKLRIRYSEQKSMEYFMQINAAKHLIGELEAMMEVEARERASLSASISASRRLSLEMLSLISYYYVIEHCGTPWCLTQVSSAFRKAAFATHSVSSTFLQVLLSLTLPIKDLGKNHPLSRTSRATLC